MTLVFPADMVSRALRKFSDEQIDAMEVAIDTEKRQLIVRVVALAEAVQLLQSYGMHLGKDFKLSDAIRAAGELLIELEKDE
jgi:hypothetical protein